MKIPPWKRRDLDSKVSFIQLSGEISNSKFQRLVHVQSCLKVKPNFVRIPNVVFKEMRRSYPGSTFFTGADPGCFPGPTITKKPPEFGGFH